MLKTRIRVPFEFGIVEALLAFRVTPVHVTPHSWKIIQAMSGFVNGRATAPTAAAALIATVLPYDRMVNGLIGDGFCGLDRSGSWVQICPNHFVAAVRSRWVRAGNVMIAGGRTGVVTPI
ncbi:hypothetical protein ACLOJK_019319 [Asimina triloba]